MISLEKDQELSLEKKVSDDFLIGAGWDPATKGKSVDLDLIAVVLDDKNVPATGNIENSMCFFNNKKPFIGALVHSGDDRTGTNSDGGDDETIKITISKLPGNAKTIMLYLVSYNGQSFREVNNEYMSIRSVDGAPIAEFKLDTSDGESIEKFNAVEMGKLYKKDGKWIFKAVVYGFDSTKLNGLIQRISDLRL
jgi:tellurium resistance protein TerD